MLLIQHKQNSLIQPSKTWSQQYSDISTNAVSEYSLVQDEVENRWKIFRNSRFNIKTMNLYWKHYLINFSKKFLKCG